MISARHARVISMAGGAQITERFMTITISNLKVVVNAPAGTVVGTLTALDDKGAVIPCNFILTKQAAGYFGIFSDNLVTAWARSIQPGNYPVMVRANGIKTPVQ
jgi:hypothetical protein